MVRKWHLSFEKRQYLPSKKFGLLNCYGCHSFRAWTLGIIKILQHWLWIVTFDRITYVNVKNEKEACPTILKTNPWTLAHFWSGLFNMAPRVNQLISEVTHEPPKRVFCSYIFFQTLCLTNSQWQQKRQLLDSVLIHWLLVALFFPKTPGRTANKNRTRTSRTRFFPASRTPILEVTVVVVVVHAEVYDPCVGK